MAENEPEEPTFVVQRIETSEGHMVALVPQFQPSDLSTDEREVYDTLRDAGAGHHPGAIAVNELAESRFEDGETVTLLAVVGRYGDTIHDTYEQSVAVLVDFARQLAPAVQDMAEAMQPLAELGERMDADESDREDSP